MGENEKPALLYAAFKGVTSAAELLIRNGADVNIVGQGGNTAIILASKGGKNNLTHRHINLCVLFTFEFRWFRSKFPYGRNL